MSHETGAVYEFDAFRVVLRTRTLLRGDEVVALPPKAYDTLVVLLARRGEDVSKSELLDAVWPGVFVEENNLSQAISTLRKALGERPHNHQFILTRPGRGYRFVAPPEPAWAAVRSSGRPSRWAAHVVALNLAALLVRLRRA